MCHYYGIIFISRGLLRCSFSRNGQCEGLEVRDEQSNPRFFYVDNINILNIYIMVTFISLLSVLAFVAFIVGMINPSLVLRWNSNPTRLKVFGYYLLVGFVLAFIGAMFSDDNKRDSTSVENAVKESVETIEENSKSKYIEGVDVKSIGDLFEDKYSFIKDKKNSGGDKDFGYSAVWTKQQNGLDFRLDTYCSDDKKKIESIRLSGRVVDLQEKSVEATRMYIMALASLNYKGADVDKAKKWVSDNFYTDKATTDIGGVRFTIHVPSEWVRMLILEKAK